MYKQLSILTAFVLSFFMSFAQPSQYTPMTAQGYQFKRILCDSTLHLPSFCGVPTLRNSTAKNGALAMDTCNNKLYQWTRANGWTDITTGGVDTTSLSNRIDARVKYTDTATMLLPYLRKVDTTAMLSKYLRKVDTTAMLQPYLRKVDTASLSNRINLKVNISDTATMLTPYLRKIDTTAMLSKYLRKTDTTAMLSKYLRKVDTTAMLLPYLRKVDTTGMLLPYLRKIDTTAMLVPYLRKIDTTAMLSKYLRKIDTTAMLLPYLRKVDTTNKWVTNVVSVNDTTFRVFKGTTSTDITIHAGGGGSGTTPDLQAVTTAGATTDQMVTMSQYGGIFQNEYNKTEIVGGIVNFYPFYSQYTTTPYLIYIRGTEAGLTQAGNEFEYFNGIAIGDHVKINPDVIELAGGGGGNNVQIIPTHNLSDVHYLPISDGITDTLATLEDVRNGGGGSGFVPYTGATQDVDLGANKISAHSVYVTGTNGNGHVHLKHQASDATATGQSTSLFADSNGDIKWKNDGNYYTTLKTSTNTADAVYTFPSATTTLIGAADTSAFQRKNISAYSFKANNTNAPANVTDQAFRDTSGTYSSTITWTGTTAPSGTANHSFRFTRVGKQVTANIHLNYGTAGSTLTAVQMALPTSFPTPAEPAGLGAANDMLYPAVGYLNTGNTVPSSTPRAALRVNPADNGWELYIVGGAGNYKAAWISVTYYTN